VRLILPIFLLPVLWLLAACAPTPSLEVLYAPLREAHTWSYHVKREGLGATYEDRITLETQPQADGSSLLKVHLLPDANDPKVGARHTYRLDFSSLPPKLQSLETEAGKGRFEPGLPFPDFLEARGAGAARYASGRGLLAGREFQVNWRYAPIAADVVQTPLGAISTVRTDLELRSSYRLTDCNLRLEFAPKYGLVRAEWTTIYGTRTVFTLESFDVPAK
jgi:hypothetical protein